MFSWVSLYQLAIGDNKLDKVDMAGCPRNGPGARFEACMRVIDIRPLSGIWQQTVATYLKRF